jgi:hypothetical protein
MAYNLHHVSLISFRSKILAIKQALSFSLYVFYLDSDALFAKFDVPLLPFLLSLSNGKDVVFSMAFRGLPHNTSDDYVRSIQNSVKLNSGAVFLKASKFSLDLLNRVYVEAPNSSYWGTNGNPFHDQSGFMTFQRKHQTDWLNNVSVVHYKYFNTWEKYFDNSSLVFHSAGGAQRRMKYERIVMPKCLQLEPDVNK